MATKWKNYEDKLVKEAVKGGVPHGRQEKLAKQLSEHLPGRTPKAVECRIAILKPKKRGRPAKAKTLTQTQTPVKGVKMNKLERLFIKRAELRTKLDNIEQVIGGLI